MKHTAFTMLMLALVSGCGDKGPSARSLGEGTAGGEVVDGGRCAVTADNQELTEYDTSGDERPDVRKLFARVGEGALARMVLICREADLNADGRKDVVRFYTEEGRPRLEEADRDFDGRMDEITHFTAGRITLQEMDTTGDGKVDTKVFYERGQPVRGERDIAGRSSGDTWQADRWEYYEDGRTVRIGTDVDGDGKVDRWDRDEERMRKSAFAQDQASDERAN